MNCLQKPCLHFFLLLLPFTICAQDSSLCRVRISLLTCAPGQELYSTFGHTALRVIDSTSQSDIVFNYGTFDFDDPDFYMKFVRGKLDYFLSVNTFPDFMYEYREDQRSVWEQQLDLECTEKQNILTALQKNMQGANRLYKYDFLYDNCTTRVRDLLFNSLPGSGVQKPVIDNGVTSRNLIHSYLDAGGEPWSKLGIDILLGRPLDKPVTNYEAMFLPDYLLKGIDSAAINKTKPIVLQKKALLQVPSPIIATGKYTPFITISIVCFGLFLIYQLYRKRSLTTSRLIDSFLLYVTGLLGMLLLFMWFGTDHSVCKENYNLLWALPTNIIAAFFLWRNPLWLRRYFYIVFILTALLLVTWFWLPQEMNIALAPLALLMLYRYGKLAMQRQPV